MERSEIIYISSDDEGDTQQNDSSRLRTPDLQTSGDDSSNHMKLETVSEGEGQRENNAQKRRASQTNEPNNSCTAKRVKQANDKNECETVTNNDCRNSCVSESEPLQKTQGQKKVLKPQLIVKEKRSILEMEQDIFPMFISLCLQKDRSEDMKIIVNKLKRRYEQLDPNYAHSDAFTSFLNEKRNDIMNSTLKLYIHIKEVMSEMKKSCKGRWQLPSNENHVSRASCSNAVGTSNSVKSNVERSYDMEQGEEEEDTKNGSTEKNIRRISKAMRECEKHIKKLEKSETDFDDENNSNYIKLDSYKYKMIELYNKYCELTGESADAGRTYLRPKLINVSGIAVVDQAITSFINSKILKRSKLKRIGAFAEAVIFPDYRDVVQCVKRCNESHNLQLDNRKQHQIAKKTFIQLGEKLQRMRRIDYWETFSLFFENEDDDPALKDLGLEEKLMKNKKEGEKRLVNVLQKYVKKQEEQKDIDPKEGSVSENEEEDEDNSIENVDENVDDQDEGDDDQDEDIDNCEDAHIDDQISVIENGKSKDQEESLVDKSISKQTTEYALDKYTSNKYGELNLNNDTRNNNLEHSLANDESIGDVTEVDETLGASKISHAKHSPQIVKIIEPRKINIDGSVNIVTCTNNANLSSKQKTDITSSNVITSSNAISSPVVKSSIIPTGEEDGAPNVVSEEVMNNDAVEEEKPVLRVRSFAKPPTTWEDERQRMDRSGTDESATKVVSKDSFVDLTIEMPKSPVVKKCTKIQIGSKMHPVGKEKRKTLVIPAGNSVISVKNITNNYVKLNARSIDPSTVSKFRNSQVMRSLRQVVGLNSGSTIIRVPFATQPTANTAGAKNAPHKRNEKLVRIIQPNNKMIVLPAKQVGENTSKTLTKILPATKPK